MPKKDKLITLKEASSLSGYSADYIGQLIRSGKIPGKQVYTNITWMTTADSVLSYKERRNKNNQGILKSHFEKLLFEFQIMKLFFQTFKTALPYLAVVAVFLSFSTYYLVGYIMREETTAEAGVVAGVSEQASDISSY